MKDRTGWIKHFTTDFYLFIWQCGLFERFNILNRLETDILNVKKIRILSKIKKTS
jgi:hypothetical protein